MFDVNEQIKNGYSVVVQTDDESFISHYYVGLNELVIRELKTNKEFVFEVY